MIEDPAEGVIGPGGGNEGLGGGRDADGSSKVVRVHTGDDQEGRLLGLIGQGQPTHGDQRQPEADRLETHHAGMRLGQGRKSIRQIRGRGVSRPGGSGGRGGQRQGEDNGGSQRIHGVQLFPRDGEDASRL